ncbi:MAG: carbon monoxide dehydrogenase [Spirochaetes bacterium]|nr:MAG: carbon monoxide dehydrogenase [Spirochaetota bacterium]
MKIAVTGKGGVGKSTLVALMARVISERGDRVIAIDADPDMNLFGILGVPENRKITPISEMKELIAERTGVEPGQPAPFFTMNPKVDDIPDRYCIEHKGIKLLVMGTVSRGGGGCACPENAFLKSLLTHLVIAREEWVLLDMEAGIEHLGRGTALGVDVMLIVVEPSRASLETSHRIEKLAGDIGIKKLAVVGNKIQDEEELQFLKENLGDLPLVGHIEYSSEIKKINLRIITAMEVQGRPLQQVEELIHKL